MADSLNELQKEIKDQLPSNLYLIYGEEQFLVSKYFNDFKNIIVNNDNPMSDMNMDIFEGDKVPVGTIADAFSTLSFSSDRRFVGVKDSGLFARGRTASTSEIVDYLVNLDESVVLTFIETDVDKRNKLYKYIQKNGKVFELNLQDEKRLISWVSILAKEYNANISKGDIQYLITILNFNMYAIKGELEKLINYKNDCTITKADIDALVTKPLEIRTFDLIDAISVKNSSLALSIYADMLEMKESPIKILANIGRQFKLMLMCKTLMKAGLGKDAIAKKISAHPFVVQKCMGFSKNFTEQSLNNAYEDIFNTDVSIKRGLINDKMGIELIIIKYCNNKGE